MYIPEYLKNIQSEMTETQRYIQNALDKLENSVEYNDHLHPFHAAAVSTYNKLVTVAITIDNLEVAQ